MQAFLVLLGAFLGGFVSGLTGFGTGLTVLLNIRIARVMELVR